MNKNKIHSRKNKDLPSVLQPKVWIYFRNLNTRRFEIKG